MLSAIFLLGFTEVAQAFWRLPCYSRLGVFRIDPIVFPGVPSSHSHTLHDEDVSFTSTYEDVLQSNCSTCAVVQDKSVYWTPLLMFAYQNGTVQAVPQIGGMLVYYFLFGNNITAFPKGFQMIAGDAKRRTSSLPTPVPPLSSWGPEDKEPEALAQKALGFNCLNAQRPAEGALQRHYMPNRSFIDTYCIDGIRAELMFPSCWDGNNLDSKDHSSHMAYPDQVMEGNCPSSHRVRLPGLYYETIWNTSHFRGEEGEFAYSNGDVTGYSYHGDFLNGWDIDVLAKAVRSCTNLSGRVEDCAEFSLQPASMTSQCMLTAPHILRDEDCIGPRKGYCGM